MTPNEIEELEIQKSIFKHINDFKSFCFNAGAGAGKTYALIETLKYVIIDKIIATNSPQKAICITYTNVAVNEIKSRLGNSNMVHVSTIHERLWEIIKRYQPQLLICHKEKIKETINANKETLLESDKTKFFNNLNKQQQQEFIKFAMKTKEIFYQSEKLGANPFRDAYRNSNDITLPDFIGECWKNKEYFRYTINLLYKIQRWEDCLTRIEAKQENRVTYDSKVNNDRLHYMKFSHDTLLEYGLKLVETYPILCRIIIDSYPYFFIDEYQDTHRNVIKFVKTIHDYAEKNNKDWMVGYFGDTAQNIYNDGVGQEIKELHTDLVYINKIFNRRSHQQIIDVANEIRADEIIQVPIFEDRNDGSVQFFYNNSESEITTVIQDFLNKYKQNIATDEDKIHCLVLTNKLMASFNEFSNVYEVYRKSTIYYNDLNAQVLSQQLEKLHPIILIIYNFVKLYRDIQQGVVSYYDIFGTLGKNITFSKASKVIRNLETSEVTSLNDWINFIANLLEDRNIKIILSKILINRINYEPDQVISSDKFQSAFLDSIDTLMNGWSGSEDEKKSKEKVDSVLALPITSLIKWVNFIDNIKTNDIGYHTYHGTKGEEYKNVAIILEHSFGRMNKNKFKRYFEIIQQDMEERERLLSDPETKKEYINTQNLLYVACSRAIKNLRILYLDDISEIKNGIKTIFGESKPWLLDESQSFA